MILAQTVKGFTLGKGFESKNANHQMKKLTVDEFKDMRDLLELPIPDSAFADGQVPYGHPGADSPEVRYLTERRAALGGPAPARRTQPVAPLPAPADKAFAAFDKGSGSQSVATTMAFVRLVKDLVRDKETGKRWVPIVPDEARTFGMESLFPSLGIYSPKGQTYEPVDRDQLMYYKEAVNGQILNEGITGKLDGRLHRRRLRVLHARRADDPLLHLLLDVRLAADRRPDVAARRPARPRLPRRRHRRTHHPDR